MLEVRPTMQAEGVSINDDKELEREAEVMGARALQMRHTDQSTSDAAAHTTIDHDIYFREGAYRPGTADGNALTAREVAHIQRTKLTGSSNAKPSAETSGAEKQDAENVAGIVQTMGPNPAQILQPVSKKPTPAQQRVIQRANGDHFSGSRTAGIVTSKVVQSIFTTVLGPVGLVWRGPLIQKNLGEIWGKNIASRPGKVDDRKRYGETHLGTAMRWLASMSELLKEFTIWLGFGTFIAAIVAGATHGVAAPVFAGLAIATAVTAGLHFVLRALLVALNGYRLYRKQKQVGGKDHEKAAKAETAIPFIKHQMVSDGMEGLSAALTAVLSAVSGAGLGSLGGDLASAAGHSTTASATQAADPGRLARFGLDAATVGIATSVGTNTLKEGGKDYVKADTKTTGFFGSAAKGDRGGFGKDYGEIKTNYKSGLKALKSPFTKDKSDAADQRASEVQVPQPSAEATQAIHMVEDIDQKAVVNVQVQKEHTDEAEQQQKVISDSATKMVDASNDVGTTIVELKKTEGQAVAFQSKLPDLVEQTVANDPNKLNDLTNQTNKALEKSGEAPIAQAQAPGTPTSGDVKQSSQDPALDQQAQTPGTPVSQCQRHGIGSHISSWFSSKLSALKAGVSRLNNKILKGVMKYASKFNNSEEDRKAVALAMNEERAFTAKDVKDEHENDGLFTEFQGKAAQLNQGIHTLAERENQGQ